MSLIDLKNYLCQQQEATLNELAHHFDTSPQTVQAMLDYWQRKGKVVPISVKSCQKGCAGCTQRGNVFYRWQKDSPPHDKQEEL